MNLHAYLIKESPHIAWIIRSTERTIGPNPYSSWNKLVFPSKVTVPLLQYAVNYRTTMTAKPTSIMKKTGTNRRVMGRSLIIIVACFKKIECILQLSVFLSTVIKISNRTSNKITAAIILSTFSSVWYKNKQTAVTSIAIPPAMTAA